ncbi:MAG: MBL fold metallo-hydrolase [Elusimicrobia bacterium]|nr:MBL fold metallo-hydrolase [Elusimicrobiota bacterium]
MLENLHWLGHAGFYVKSRKGTIVYFDPYQVSNGLPKADVILVSHDHFDHCSAADIAKIAKPQTVIVGPSSIASKLTGAVKTLAPGGKLVVGDIAVETVEAYNPGKPFHPKSSGNLGFIAAVDGVSFYHAGDTDVIPEMKRIKADVALLPVGGTYTMTAAEAAEAAAAIKPKVAVPMHYGSVAGSIEDAKEFQKLCKSEVRILKQE